jgi:protein-tyrosine phosphatase
MQMDVSFAQIRSDDFVAPSFKILSEGADLIDAYIGDAKGKVYVHCKSGIGRSASLVIAYLVRHKVL